MSRASERARVTDCAAPTGSGGGFPVRKVLLVPLLVLLAACGGGGSAGVEPTALPPITATPSASASPAALPSPSRTGVEGEVEAAVLEYFAGLNEAFATGDTSRMLAAQADCEECVEFAERVERLFDRGDKLVGARDTIVLRQVVVLREDVARAKVELSTAPYTVVRADGTTADVPPSTGVLNIDLYDGGDGWSVAALADANA